MKIISTDVVIVGSGVAGLSAALSFPDDMDVLLITKKELEDSNSYLAQGGISIRRGPNDRKNFIEDTLKAGHYKNSLKAVEIMVDESESALEFLIDMGVNFTRKNGEIAYTKEGGHDKFRIAYSEDVTGKAIMDGLIARVKEKKNIKIITNCEMNDLIVDGDHCVGIYAKPSEVNESNGTIEGNEIIEASEGINIRKETEVTEKAKNNEGLDLGFLILAKDTVLATGGIGGIYSNSTNFPHIRGDGVALAIKHGIKLKDISYVQIHPTSLYENKKGRRFLISESVRGEGAVLLNHRGLRFTDELKPRDIVSKAIYEEMKKDDADHEYLNMRTIDLDIGERFPNICKYLSQIGIDPMVDNVPVVPAQHYTMGGIEVDTFGCTSMKGLYAIGEASCTGVHGQNRLASNSLLESVVFGRRAAKSIADEHLLEKKIAKKNNEKSVDDKNNEINYEKKNHIIKKNTGKSKKIEVDSYKFDELMSFDEIREMINSKILEDRQEKEYQNNEYQNKVGFVAKG